MGLILTPNRAIVELFVNKPDSFVAYHLFFVSRQACFQGWIDLAQEQVVNMRNLPRGLLARYWIWLVAITVLSLGSLTHASGVGAQSQETPRIDTVPDLELIPTPVNTPFPMPTPVGDDGNGAGSNDAPANTTSQTGGGTGSAPVSAMPVSAGPAPISTTQSLTGVVAVTMLNLHRAPSLSANRIDTLFLHEPVTLLGKSQEGTWWYVCCGTASGRAGWARVQDISTPATVAALNNLLPLGPGQSTERTVTTTATGVTDQSQANAIQVTMRPEPAFVWQGSPVRLHLTITNPGKAPLQAIQLRDHLPPTLRLIEATAQGGQVHQQQSPQGGTIVTIEWAQAPPGGTVSAVLALQVAEDIAPGTLIDNLALVSAANRADTPVGVTLAMPPTVPPQFRAQ
jgi:uncharacterized repeat protein (TIGR01451 family)